MDIHSKCRA